MKHRAETDSRTVPCCHDLTDILRQHIKRFDTTREGYLFRGTRGGTLGSTAYSNAWAKAREKAFTPDAPHTYAKCFDGGEQAALDRLEALLTPRPQDDNTT